MRTAEKRCRTLVSPYSRVMESRIPVPILSITLVLASCGRISFESHDAGIVDGNTGIARCFADPGSTSTLSLDVFEVEYATPNTLRLRWESTDPMDEFSQYEVHLMDSEQAECQVQRFDSSSNPGLGYFRSPTVGHQITSTSIGQLAPQTTYVVQLIVRDRNGGELSSALVSAQTAPPPSGQVVLFSEDDTAGYSIPSDLTYASGPAYAGSQYYEFLSPCEGNACFENLRRQAIDVSLASMTEEDFGRAYYEFALASSGAEHSYWSQARLMFQQADGSRELFVYAPFVLKAGDNYHLYQIPLQAFGQEGLSVPLTYESAKLAVYEFTVGGSWPLGETVRLDELRIRW